MDNITEIRIEYKYYTKNRVTPIFITNDELLSFTFESFYGLILKEIPYLKKMSSECVSLRMIMVDENGGEVDISSKYFSYQMLSLLNKGVKMIFLRVVAAESPVLVRKMSAGKDEIQIPQLESRSLKVKDSNITTICGHANTCTTESSPKQHQDNPGDGVVLPLERYAEKQEKDVQYYSEELASKTKELSELDLKLHKASDQNRGPLNVCGNCHLKLGHNRKACGFSPCTSAFSCGLITKHNDQKSLRASLVKKISQLQNKLAAANNEVQSTRVAVEKVHNSSRTQKKIENVILQEYPQRYMVNGLRNWLQLNQDVALLQSKLRGELPTRDNVVSLLRSTVNDNSFELQTTSTTTKPYSTPLRDIDHRLSPQKRVFEQQCSMVFPCKKSSSRAFEESTVTVVPDSGDQAVNEFKLALKLEKEEM